MLMTDSHLQVTTQIMGDRTSGWVVVRAVGDLDLATADRFRVDVAEAIAGRSALRLVLDLSGLVFCDSTGVGALVGIYKDVRAGAGTLVLAGVPEHCLLVLNRTGLDRLFTLAPDVETAMAEDG
jgi:anti-sigma B factor antagonist